MTTIKTGSTKTRTKAILLGSGELGKEIAIELMRLGIEVIAVDHYENAPAMQIANRFHVINMQDAFSLKNLIEAENPHFIIPEVEAIATETLVELEKAGFKVVPNAYAANITMNRAKIRQLAHELKLPTSKFLIADSFKSLEKNIEKIKFPCIVKPIMSSSGKGQSIVHKRENLKHAWEYAQKNGRTQNSKVIVENFIDFDYEITLLTVREKNKTTFCEPIGHIQKNGDYQISWQPQKMSQKALQTAKEIALKITDKLGGCGIFGVELFVKKDKVWFNEVSPRPHDTGLVTLISQNHSEFALHVKAFLGLNVPEIEQIGPSASKAIIATGHSATITFKNIDKALTAKNTDLKIFGKPFVNGKRRVAVALARDKSIQKAREKVIAIEKSLKVIT